MTTLKSYDSGMIRDFLEHLESLVRIDLMDTHLEFEETESGEFEMVGGSEFGARSLPDDALQILDTWRKHRTTYRCNLLPIVRRPVSRGHRERRQAELEALETLKTLFAEALEGTSRPLDDFGDAGE